MAIGAVLIASLTATLVRAEEVATDTPPPAATEIPAPPSPPPTGEPSPTDPPLPPTALPTVIPTQIPPTPTVVPPTDVPATDVPPTDQPAATGEPTTGPTAAPTEEPAFTPTEEPTTGPTATPTEEPVPPAAPELIWTLADEPECDLAPDQPAAIASGGSLVYDCASTLDLLGTGIVPANVGVAWTVRATLDGAWGIQLLPPTNDPDDTVTWTELRTGEASFEFIHRDPAGTAPDAGPLDLAIEMAWSVRILRPACDLTPPALRIAHEVTVTSPGATVTPDPAMSTPPEPLRIDPLLQSTPGPVVAFAGPLDFGQIGATAAGLLESSRTGTLELVITGLDRACGTWELRLSAGVLVDGAGTPLPGSRLVITAIAGIAVPGGGCDLAAGCLLMSFDSGPDAPVTTTIALTVDLRMPASAAPGTFSTTIDAALQPGGAGQESDSPAAMREQGGARRSM